MDQANQINLLRVDFNRHEDRDEERFKEVRQDLKSNYDSIAGLQQKLANLLGRLSMLGAAAIVIIPVLTEIVRAYVDSHFGVK